MSHPPSPEQFGEYTIEPPIYHPGVPEYPGVYRTSGMSPEVTPQSQPRNRAVPVLAAAVTVLCLVTATLTVLFLQQRADYAAVQRKATIAAGQEQRFSEIHSRLTTADADLEHLRRQLATARGQSNDATEQKKIVATCLRLTFDFLTTLSTGDQADKTAAQGILDRMRTPCHQAEPYVKE